ncbi:MAG: HD domain-containing phosphohydrolase [Planctomycetota bacterium]
MPQIRVKNGPQKDKILPLTGSEALVIGRDAACALQIMDKGVSREHAKIFRVGEMVFIRDLDSRNGSFVNEEPVKEELLRVGDLVRVGVTQLIFESKSGTENRNLQYEDEENFKTSLELKFDDLYVLETSATGREGDLFKAMCQAAQIAQSECDEKKLFDRLLTLIQEHIPADYLYLFLRDERTGAVTPRAMIPKPSDSNVPISRSILRRVISESRAILTADAMQDERFKNGESIVINNIRSVLCVPVQSNDKQALGALYAVNTRLAETFEQIDLQLLTALGAQLALSLSNLQSNRERRRMFFRAIGRLMSLVEGNPSQRQSHADRVSLYCSAIAAQLGLSDTSVLVASLAGLLHDIGKTPAVSSLSAMVGEYSPDVASALATADFFQDIHSLDETLNAIRSQHEHYDGSGVPQQLKDVKIPQGARILSVANIFDQLIFPNGNLTSDADFDSAMIRKAFIEMERDSGKRFDPEVASALMIAYRNGALRFTTGEVMLVEASELAMAAMAQTTSLPTDADAPTVEIIKDRTSSTGTVRVADQAEEVPTLHGITQREQGRTWVQTWEKADLELERIHAEELAAMTEDAARQAMLDIFDLWTPPEEAAQSSGLVEQQQLFVRFQQIMRNRQ